MCGKIIKLVCIVAACIASTNLLFIGFCVIMNIEYIFNIFSCLLAPAAIGIFVVSVMDSAALGDERAERLSKELDNKTVDKKKVEDEVDTDE